MDNTKNLTLRAEACILLLKLQIRSTQICIEESDDTISKRMLTAIKKEQERRLLAASREFIKIKQLATTLS